jgi:hypothetical protein
MPTDAATGIAYAGAIVGLIGGGVALFNSWKAVRWKRAEFANNFMKDFSANPELVFAGRCLDWNGGRLLLPENLRAYMPDNAAFIEHDRHLFAIASRADLPLGAMDDDPRIQIYRTSIDTFLTWLSLVTSALDRKLFMVEDIQEAGYWVAKIQSEVVLHGFIMAYGYKDNIDRLIRYFRRGRSTYRLWIFPTNWEGLLPKQRRKKDRAKNG